MVISKESMAKQEQSTEDIYKLFERASTIPLGTPKGYMSEWEREHRIEKNSYSRRLNGIKNFKRHVLGFCRSRSVKTLDEFTDALLATKLISTREEAPQLIENLDGVILDYDGTDRFPKHYLDFQKVSDEQGKIGFRICFGTYHYPQPDLG